MSVKKKLSSKYYCFLKDPNVLSISEDKSVLPYAHIIADEAHPQALLLSLAIDYPNPSNVADVALQANSVCPIVVSEEFYISPHTGNTYFSEDAHMQYELDALDLEHMHPPTDSIN